MSRMGIDLGFTQEERDLLLYLARGTVEGILTKQEPVYGRISKNLGANPNVKAVFVTIYKKNELRGCVGTFNTSYPIYMWVMETAKKSAFSDTRFQPVKLEELPDLKYEISVITPFEQITTIEEIEVGKHGLMIQLGYKSGLLLPQVALDFGWDAEAFLYHVCVKAGIHPKIWQQCLLFRFTADVWKEK